MTEPEKYTLPRVLEIVRGHAQALEVAGKALEASEGNDVEINAMLGREHRPRKRSYGASKAAQLH